MLIQKTGDKKDTPKKTQPARHHAPARDGQGGGDTIPTKSTPAKEPSTN